MPQIIPGESIWFERYETDHFVEYQAIARVVDSEPHGEANLSWFDEDGKETQANNIKNIEDISLGATEDYWRARYSSVDLSWIGNSYLDTIRVEKGDMVLYRKWNTSTFWQEIYFAVVVATLGSPTNPHPVINLKYVNSSGTVITVPSLDCFEQFDDEDDAQGNDLWSNIPIIIESV